MSSTTPRPRRVEIESRTRLLSDFLAVDELRLRFERFDGSMSPTVRRLTLERGDSVAALLYDRVRDRVLLVEQFRHPTLGSGDGWITEVVAGALKPDEDPAAAVRREVLEETGWSADRLEPIGCFHVSPGGSSERIHLYFAEVSERPEAGGGAVAENEDIRVVSLAADEARAWASSGEVADAKTLIALMWFAGRTA